MSRERERKPPPHGTNRQKSPPTPASTTTPLLWGPVTEKLDPFPNFPFPLGRIRRERKKASYPRRNKQVGKSFAAAAAAHSSSSSESLPREEPSFLLLLVLCSQWRERERERDSHRRRRVGNPNSFPPAHRSVQKKTFLDR